MKIVNGSYKRVIFDEDSRGRPLVSDLQAAFYYKDGVLYNKIDRGRTAKAGTPVSSGTKVDYYQVRLNGKPYRHHVIIFAIVHGRYPNKFIDHINGDTKDNRIENLREVDRVDNQRNMKRMSTNRSGYTGVHSSVCGTKFCSFIHHKNKKIHLGTFATVDEAIASRQTAEKLLGYHPNHGRD